MQEVIGLMPESPPERWWESLRSELRWIDEETIATLQQIDVPVAAINRDQPPTDVATYQRPLLTVRLMTGRGHLGVIWEETGQFDRHLRAIVEKMGG
ncbi:MAG: hypothetical protein PVJ49_09405 [Acidobacteriota bacterium]